MRHNPDYVPAPEDETALVRRLVRENPWVTIVSAPPGGLVASHYPVLLEDPAPDDDADAVVLVSHVGRPDERLHELGAHPVLVVVQGPHGYVSPGWYEPAPAVPTWNFVTAHLTGVPELLGPEENLAVLDRLVEHFEAALSEPRLLHAGAAQSAYAHQIVRGTVGFRLRVTGVTTKQKMSQAQPSSTRQRIVAELEGDGPYASAALAREMRLADPDGRTG